MLSRSKGRETMFRQSKAATLLAATALSLAACATTPMGPTVNVLPGPNKPFDQFQADVASCKSYAESQVAGQAEAANNQAVGTAVVGTLLGAGLGAAVGGGRGAAIGAGAGAVGGTAIGANGSERGEYAIQRRYNNAYSQCMYGHGNQVPGYAATPVYVPVAPVYAAPPPAYPPPPPGYAPPPPPGYAPPPPPPR
jgi:hypothetical protein